MSRAWLLPALMVGCAPKEPVEAAASQAPPPISERPTEEGLVLQSVDLDGDGKVDITNHYRERTDGPRLLVRKGIDLNHDQKPDVISFFDDFGVLVREEMDSDLDGTFDLTDHYEGGVRVMSEYGTGETGSSKVFRYFVKASDGSVHLERKERDEDGDGRVDVWERFDEQGNVIRSGRDTDGDGKLDLREE